MSSGYKKTSDKKGQPYARCKTYYYRYRRYKNRKSIFRRFASPEWFKSSRVQVEVLSSTKTDKAPQRVLAELDRFKRQYRLDKNDELWMVIDVDRWGDKNLSTVAQLCQQKKYSLAISNPCFELWLLLHLKSLDDYSAEMQAELLKNERVSGNRTRLEQELLEILESYNKSKPDTSQFLPSVEKAIERAKALDDPDDRWPQHLGTRVYLLVSKIVSIAQQ